MAMNRGSLAVSLVLILAACHPTEPKQANIADPADPNADTSSPSSGSGGSSSGKSGGDPLSPPPPAGGKPVKGEKGEPPVVSTLAEFQEGLRWGMSHADVQKMFTQQGGVIWKDFDERLTKARVGPEQTAIEAEREQAKAAFGRSYIEFKDTPTGYDATGIKGEYSYKNKESLMWVTRQGKKRFFFFINDRLWKVYDEYPLAEGGPMGKAYLDAVNQMNAKLGAQGRVLGANADKGITSTTVDYKDGSSHLRIVDRSAEKLVGVVLEDNSTLGNLTSLRSNKPDDPNAIDPTVAAVTKGGLSDPNAPAPGASGKPGDKKKPAPPKK
jgi:hypothetical protein